MESIQATRGTGVTDSGKLLASDTFAQSSYVRWTVNKYSKTMLVKTAVYLHLPSGSSDPDSDGFIGTKDTDYNVTTFTYDSSGRRNRVESPGGTITRSIFDERGQTTAVYVGTDDVPTSGEWSPTNNTGANMVQVTGYQYDGGNAGGDGNLTQATQHMDGSTTRATTYGYDWRDRQETVTTNDGTQDLISRNTTIDNLDRVTEVIRYKTSVADGNRIGKSKTYLDDLGRVYKSEMYAVDPSNGNVGSALASNTWYDADLH